MINPVIPKIINSAGLFLDLIGVLLVAYEIVQKFEGEKYGISMTWGEIASPPEETDAYKKWERKKFRAMSIGLLLIVFGFFLQISSNWTESIYALITQESTISTGVMGGQ